MFGCILWTIWTDATLLLFSILSFTLFGKSVIFNLSFILVNLQYSYYSFQ